jgi:type II secretory pathway component GspD/PulD (secretin)
LHILLSNLESHYLALPEKDIPMTAKALKSFTKTLTLTGVIAAASLFSQSALAGTYELLGKPNYTTEVIQLDNIEAANLVPLLRPYADRDGQLSVISASNTIILTSSDDRRAKMIEFIRTYDGLGLNYDELKAKAVQTLDLEKPQYKAGTKKQIIIDKKRQQEAFKNIELVEKVIQLDQRIFAAELIPVLRPYASRKGTISVNSELNQIKIREYETGIDELVALINELEMLALNK